MQSIAIGSAQSSTAFLLVPPSRRDGRPPPPAEGATSLLLRRLRGRLLKRTSPDGLWPHAGFILVARGDFISIVLSHNE